jgi:hypothetical protein
MMIDETKPPYPRPLEGRALFVGVRALLGSTHSYHFSTKKTGAALSSAGHRPTAGDERRR